MQKGKLRILPLGGLGEIGMNCMLLEWEQQFVLIDCGLQFPDATYPGVELLMPDLNYVRERLDNLLGIVVTHGHDDHIGAIGYLARDRKLEVWATPFPEGLIRNRMQEIVGANPVRFHRIEPRKKFTVGPFEFDPISVQHSIIEALAFAIKTPVGTIIHSGDFKHDPMEVDGEAIGFGAFEEYGKSGVLLLLSDSTNAERCGHTLSEQDIEVSFRRILGEQKGRILIALFASNIRRVETLLKLAKEQGKKVAFAGRSMHSYTRLAFEQASLTIPENTLVLLENSHEYPDEKLIILSTGSQAEPQSALVRIAQGTHHDFQVRSGDTVILSSRFIPGNEKNISAMIDQLYRKGAEVWYESVHQIHVSGHGFQEELLMMLRATQPKFFIPIHGEYRHLAKHAKLAIESGLLPQNVKIIEDGQSVGLDATSLELGERITIEKLPIVSGLFMDSAPETFVQRVNLAKTGIVYVSVLCTNRRKRKLAARPAVSAYGLLLQDGEVLEEVLQDAEEFVEDVLHDAKDWDDMNELLRLELRRFFRKRASHKPVVVSLVLDV